MRQLREQIIEASVRRAFLEQRRKHRLNQCQATHAAGESRGRCDLEGDRAAIGMADQMERPFGASNGSAELFNFLRERQRRVRRGPPPCHNLRCRAQCPDRSSRVRRSVSSIDAPSRASNAEQLQFRSDAEYSAEYTKWSSDHSQLCFGIRKVQM